MMQASHNDYRDTAGKPLQRAVFNLTGLCCTDCARRITAAVRAMEGVAHAEVNFATSKLCVEFVPETVASQTIIAMLQSLGYGAYREGEAVSEEAHSCWQRRARHVHVAVAGLLLLGGFIILKTVSVAWIAKTLYLMGMLLAGGPIFRTAAIQVFRHRTIGMDFLMSLAVVGAVAIGEWTEAATVIFLYAIAHLLETYSMDRARHAIRALMDLSPKEAVVRCSCGDEGCFEDRRVPVVNVQIGDCVIVKPGDKVPVDGVVVAGSSTIDQSPLTGESMPVEVSIDSQVFAGTLNQQGALEVKVTKPFHESTFARILHSIEEVQAQRAPSQRFVDQFARNYTPIVICLAVLLAVNAWQPSLAGVQTDNGQWIFKSTYLYRALVFLVIACPCAMVISTPIAILSGLAKAARNGVLIKGGLHLEEAGRARAVVFDKTGTLTTGQPQVEEVYPANGISREHLLGVAAAIERWSEHPFALAIRRKAAEEEIPIPRSTDFAALPGHGASAIIVLDAKVNESSCTDVKHFIGSPRLFRNLGIIDEEWEGYYEASKILYDRKFHSTGHSAVLIGTEGRLEGCILLRDEVRSKAADTVKALRRIGIKSVGMLTGDNHDAAAVVAHELGLDTFYAGLLPEDKVNVIREMTCKHDKVIMVGDGVNDTPALAAATVGIAMGTAGSDVALETADIALMADDLSKVPFTIELSRRTVRVIKQNVAFALILKAAFVALTFAGLTTLWMAVAADMGASLLVIANSMRLQRHLPSG